MQLIPESSDITYYLNSSRIIDFFHPSILEIATELGQNTYNEVLLVKKVYEFVRDQIQHSHDIQAEKVTCKASEVLKQGHGLCFSKSFLLAAILRYLKIPTGFCYQKIRNSSSELVLHGLNAVYLKSTGSWIRLDARGNKEGINAQFDPPGEILAYTIRPELGEREYETVYFYPDEDIVETMLKYKTLDKLMENLPTEVF